jgi:hypothetical protein
MIGSRIVIFAVSAQLSAISRQEDVAAPGTCLSRSATSATSALHLTADG